MKGKFLVLLLLLCILPLLAVGGAGLYVLLMTPPIVPPPTSAPAPNAPDLGLAQNRLQEDSASLLKAIQSAKSDVTKISARPNEAEFQSFLSSHPGLIVAFRLGGDGKPKLVTPAGATLVDASFPGTEEYKNIQQRAADPAKSWPYLFYSRRVAPSFLFVDFAGGGFVGTALDIGYFFKDLTGGETDLVADDSGQILWSSNPEKANQLFNPGNDPWRASVLADLSKNASGSKATPQSAAVFVPLNLPNFGLVQVLPVPTPVVVKNTASAAEGLTLDKVIQDPSALLQNLIVLVLLGALGWVLVVGFILRSGFLKPIHAAQKVLEAAASGSAKVSEEALRRVGASEVQALVRVSTQWADRLEREKEDVSRRREEDAKKAQGQLQTRGQELTDTNQKLSASREETEQKAQQLAAKLQELEALKGMAEGLRNQAEQARGEIAKLKIQMSALENEGKQKEFSLRQQLDLQANQAQDQLKDLESKLLQAVAAANPISVSQVRVAAIKTMAEELKTTLGIIKGYVSSALGSAQGGITEKQQEFLGMVINRSARLEKFINDLVDIYQVEIDQETAPREEVALSSEIEGMAFNFQPQADIKNIKIRVEEKGEKLPKIPIVRRRFTQLWNILYLQIIKDSPRGSQVPVTVEKVGEDAKVTILDPGLTVKPELLPKLFDEFYDPKHPASPQLAGTGLKFALVKTILAAHGGGALAEKAEQGTRLILTFPTKIKKKENPAAAILASVKLPSASPPPTGGLLGAVKPGTVSPRPATAPAVPPAKGAPVVPPPGGDSMTAGRTGPGTLPPKAPLPTAPFPGTGSVIPKTPPPTPAPLGARPPLTLPTPAAPPPGAPKPAVPPPAAKPPMDLEALFNTKAPVTDAPAKPATPAPAPPPAPPPVAPPRPPASTPASSPTVAPAPPTSSAPPPKPLVSSTPSGPSLPPSPPVAASAPPPPPPIAAPKIVQTALKPSAPPPGILDLENQDGFKTDSGSSAPPKPPAPPKAPPPPPAAPPTGGAGKSIVKDLDKDSGGDSGELIE